MITMGSNLISQVSMNKVVLIETFLGADEPTQSGKYAYWLDNLVNSPYIPDIIPSW